MKLITLDGEQNAIVFAKGIDNEPFTTSKIIADHAQVEHRAVRQMIEKYRDRIERWGICAFEMSKFTDGRGRPEKVYHLNESQSIFLITLLKNTDPVVDFKAALTEQFIAMRDKLRDTVDMRDGFPELAYYVYQLYDEPKAYHFSNECNMLNRLAFGMTSKQFREAHGVPAGASIRPYLNRAEIYILRRLQSTDIVYLREHNDYQTRKAKLTAYRDELLLMKRVQALAGND